MIYTICYIFFVRLEVLRLIKFLTMKIFPGGSDLKIAQCRFVAVFFPVVFLTSIRDLNAVKELFISGKTAP